MRFEYTSSVRLIEQDGMRGADVVVERRRRAFVAADGHGAFAGRERTHALVIGELVVSDVEPTAFVRALHPHRGEDGVHRRRRVGRLHQSGGVPTAALRGQAVGERPAGGAQRHDRRRQGGNGGDKQQGSPILMTSSTSYPKELYIQQTQNIRSTVGNY